MAQNRYQFEYSREKQQFDKSHVTWYQNTHSGSGDTHYGGDIAGNSYTYHYHGSPQPDSGRNTTGGGYPPQQDDPRYHTQSPPSQDNLTNALSTRQMIDMARAGTALAKAAKNNTRCGLKNFVVAFEDALLRELRMHAISAPWTKDSQVKYYCNMFFKADPIDENVWQSTLRAIEWNMERIQMVHPGKEPDVLFGGFDVKILREMG